ncbi:MAG: HTTM domain-containing protein [Candidatus Binatia bacterium]
MNDDRRGGQKFSASPPQPNLWERYWFAPVAAVRPYLLVKAVLLLLAFDVWLLRVTNGAQFALEDFNVAHFYWLDVVQPVFTPPVYTGLLLSTGMFALYCALMGANRIALALLALSYTYSWAVSMLDGYQHHYFLSLVLLACVFFPRLRAQDFYQTKPADAGDARIPLGASTTPTRRVSAWGYVLLGVNVAIVYFFTAITKGTDERFLNGEIIRQLSGKKQLLQPLETWLIEVGVSSDAFWQALAIGTISLEIFLAVAYLLSVKQDGVRRRWLKILSRLGLVAIIVFHGLGNELLFALRIGWFSYYMIALGCVYFLPESILWPLGRILTWPALRFSDMWSSLTAALDRRSARLTSCLNVVFAFTGAAAISIIGFALDLPGATTVCLLLAFSLVTIAVASLPLRRQREAMRYVFGGSLAVGLMWTSITLSMVRFDYYDRVGAFHQYRGDRQAAIEAYEKAIRYVPIGRRNPSREDSGQAASRAVAREEYSEAIIVDGNP